MKLTAVFLVLAGLFVNAGVCAGDGKGCDETAVGQLIAQEETAGSRLRRGVSGDDVDRLAIAKKERKLETRARLSDLFKDPMLSKCGPRCDDVCTYLMPKYFSCKSDCKKYLLDTYWPDVD
jgi:hypothetical protein